MKRSDRKSLYQCNKLDLLKVANTDDQNKFSNIVKYIARHGMSNGNTKDDLYDLIYTARAELIAQEAKIHKDDGFKHNYNKLFGIHKHEEQRVKDFIRDPINTIKTELVNLARKPGNPNEADEDVITYNNKIRANCVMLVTQLNIEASSQAPKYDKDLERTDITNRLTKKFSMRGDENIDKALDRVNSGVFGRLFRRPSKEYKNFEDSFNIFRNPNLANNGDVEDLQKKTDAYLKHLIPDYDPKQLSDKKEEWLDCLPKGQRKRAEFAMNVTEAVKESKANKVFMENVEKAAKGLPIDEAAYKGKRELDPIFKEQEGFQQEIKNEINKDEINNNQPVVEEKAEKVKVAEEEKVEEVEDNIEPII